MPIVFGSKLQSPVANATWLDKTEDDVTIGIVGLNETLSGNSGPQVVNAQLAINTSRKLVNAEQVKIASSVILLNSISLKQEFRLSGSGPVTLNPLPFTNAKVAQDGTEIILVGHHDTNTVTITFNDVDYGCLLNGHMTLARGSCLTLIYNDELKRYIEVGRNN